MSREERHEADKVEMEKACEIQEDPLYDKILELIKKHDQNMHDIIDRQAEQIKAKDTYIGELLAKWNQALEQIKALCKYAEHSGDCKIRWQNGPREILCSCGLDRTLKGTD